MNDSLAQEARTFGAPRNGSIRLSSQPRAANLLESDLYLVAHSLFLRGVVVVLMFCQLYPTVVSLCQNICSNMRMPSRKCGSHNDSWKACSPSKPHDTWDFSSSCAKARTNIRTMCGKCPRWMRTIESFVLTDPRFLRSHCICSRPLQ